MSGWICPFCGHAQTLTTPKVAGVSGRIGVEDNALSESLGYKISAVGCSNPKCRQVAIDLRLGDHKWIAVAGGGSKSHLQNVFLTKAITPESSARPQPPYIPKPIIEDYVEACRIRDLSPKASATLARRCLQGMIRDFCGIRKNRLVDEIDALRKAVDAGSAPQGVSADSMDAIDGLRAIGNIGAHMEKDINLIVDVDPNEAQALIELIESLFEDWYVARQKRQERFAKVAAVATQKTASKGKAADSTKLDAEPQPQKS